MDSLDYIKKKKTWTWGSLGVDLGGVSRGWVNIINYIICMHEILQELIKILYFLKPKKMQYEMKEEQIKWDMDHVHGQGSEAAAPD